MNVVSTPDEVEPAARAVAIGSFDGVHRGSSLGARRPRRDRDSYPRW